jgi:hypothetical protein
MPEGAVAFAERNDDGLGALAPEEAAEQVSRVDQSVGVAAQPIGERLGLGGALEQSAW